MVRGRVLGDEGASEPGGGGWEIDFNQFLIKKFETLCIYKKCNLLINHHLLGAVTF